MSSTSRIVIGGRTITDTKPKLRLPANVGVAANGISAFAAAAERAAKEALDKALAERAEKEAKAKADAASAAGALAAAVAATTVATVGDDLVQKPEEEKPLPVYKPMTEKQKAVAKAQAQPELVEGLEKRLAEACANEESAFVRDAMTTAVRTASCPSVPHRPRRLPPFGRARSGNGGASDADRRRHYGAQQWLVAGGWCSLWRFLRRW